MSNRDGKAQSSPSKSGTSKVGSPKAGSDTKSTPSTTSTSTTDNTNNKKSSAPSSPAKQSRQTPAAATGDAAAATPSSQSAQDDPKASIEKYNQLKNQLTQEILKKQELSARLSNLEDVIYEKENEYFDESLYGSIVKGFENFSKASGSSGGGQSSSQSGSGGYNTNKRRVQYADEDHIFSLSSISFIKSLMKKQGISLNGINGIHTSTTPTSSNGNNGSSSSNKDSASKDKDDFDDYEDSIEPTNGSSNPLSNSNNANTIVNGGHKSASSDREGSSNVSTPSRKRKARVLDD
ncbi:chromatin modification-related protein EAF6 [Scheffersomyces amazonensis]|uniref:chromatin modification-related protein EAF6 n=1 Tax=Scheffersomyces amazonensis TaxID=1078765 RepID=UPI00315DD7C8